MMSGSSLRIASARAALASPEAGFAHVRAHIEEHGLVAEPAGPDAVRYRFEGCEAVVSHDAAELGFDLSAPSDGLLLFLKERAAGYLAEIDAAAAAALRWSDAGEPGGLPPGFRELVLLRREAVLPGLLRVTLGGEALEAWRGPGLHVRLLLPPAGDAPIWPSLAPNGSLRWPEGPDRLLVRYYTLRHVRPEAGEVDIDVALYSDGAAAGWAARAKPGARLGGLGPGGGGAPAKGRRLLIGGDMTALPALARILEADPGAEGRCVVSAPPEAAAYLRPPAGVQLDILSLEAAPEALPAALRAAVPDSGAPLQGWFAGEFAQAQAVRRLFRRELGLGPGEQLAVAYWRRGEGSRA